MPKVVKLRERSELIQLTSKEAIQEALESSFRHDESIVILYNKEENTYEWWQGGSLPSERISWHLRKVDLALLD